MADDGTNITWTEPFRLRWALPDQPDVPALVLLAISRSLAGAIFLAFAGSVVAFLSESEDVLTVAGITAGFGVLIAVVGTVATVVVDGDAAVTPNGIERNRNIWYGYEFANWPWRALKSVTIASFPTGKETFKALVLVDQLGQTHYVVLDSTKEAEVVRVLTSVGLLEPPPEAPPAAE